MSLAKVAKQSTLRKLYKMVWDRNPRDVLGLKGCIVDEAKYFQDSAGYDKILIRFTNGKTLVVLEEGQTGYFSYEVSK